MIAVGSDDSNVTYSGKVQIYEYNENTRYELHSIHQFLCYLLSVISVSKGFMLTYRKYAKAETLMTVTDPVHDIAFAPNLGRSFHVLAIATKDVRIFKLIPLRLVGYHTQ